MTPTARQPSRRRRGSTYIMILAVSIILTVIGVAAVTIARITSRSVMQGNNWAEAQTLAFSAAEHALARIRATTDWRTQFAGSTTEVTFGPGTFRWQLVDEEDGDLGDDPADPVTIRTSGSVGDAVFRLELRCFVLGTALEALKTCLHSGGQIEVVNNRTVTLTGAPLSTNSTLATGVNSLIQGDVEAQSLSGPGTITGTTTVPAPAKGMPDAGVFETYRSLATQIPYSRQIKQVAIGPGLNPWGAPNPQGVYYIDAGADDITISEARIVGTLVVRCRRLIFSGDVSLQSAEAQLPTLVVDGSLELSISSDGPGLHEGRSGTNFNPAGVPHDGGSDSDTGDSYPSEVAGLVHVTGDLDMRATSRIRGSVICEGTVSCEGDNEIIHDPNLYDTPPMGYTSVPDRVTPQSWNRVVD